MQTSNIDISQRKQIIIKRNMPRIERNVTDMFYVDKIKQIILDYEDHFLLIEDNQHECKMFYNDTDEITFYFLDTKEKIILTGENCEKIIDKIYNITF